MIEPITNELVKTIESSHKENIDLVKLFAIPKIPEKIVELKTVLT